LTNKLDLTDRLVDTLQDVAPVVEGYLDKVNATGIYPVAGSRTIKAFMNQMREDGLHYNVSTINQSPQKAELILNSIAEYLRDLKPKAVTSSNGSFIYLETEVVTPPYVSRAFDDDKLEYTMTLEVRIYR
jgi:hypothetical protein